MVAAVYLDSGFAPRAISCCAASRERIAEAAAGPGGRDYKTRLQELAAARALGRPRYVVRDEGPDHAKHFFATVYARRTRRTARARALEEASRAGRRVGRLVGVCRKRRTGRGATMPELPEVEVLRRDLEKEVVGKKIKSVEVDGHALGAPSPEQEGVHRACSTGARSSAVQRRGKYLVLRLDGPDALIVHLGMSGQLLRAKTAREKAPKHTHVVITFTQGGLLRFVDPRTFGEMFVDAVDEHRRAGRGARAPRARSARDRDVVGPASAGCSPSRHAKLKPLLMDQKFIAGIGNVYSDEILFEAGPQVGPHERLASQQEVRRLYRAIIETLQDAVKYRGSSLADEQYVDLFGKPGEYQEHHQVYDREGGVQRCRRVHRARSRTARPSSARHVRSDRPGPRCAWS